MTKGMKNCIIIHGCPSSPEDLVYDGHWISWTKQELIAKGIATEAPHIPTPWEPDYEKFKTELEKQTADENTILIGHSCGCAFLVRWLGETKRKIHKLILVAPWKIPGADDEGREKFYTYPVDASIKERVDSITLFTSNNEVEDGKKSLHIFHEALGGTVIDLPSHGHYTLDDMGTDEFPELLQAVLK